MPRSLYLKTKIALIAESLAKVKVLVLIQYGSRVTELGSLDLVRR